jgi:MFS family permease
MTHFTLRLRYNHANKSAVGKPFLPVRSRASRTIAQEFALTTIAVNGQQPPENQPFMSDAQPGSGLLGFTRYQWLVLFAAWLGWGFDVFDGLLFNYVSSNCVPTLLHIPIGTPEAKKATLEWTGTLTSILLVGWALGGIIFGKVADRIGRSKTLLITMLLYAFGTAACAFAQNIEMLIVFRIIASLGIGGEWAAGASMVSEIVPENRRVEGGALLYTAAPFGLFLATFVNQTVSNQFGAHPDVSWRYVFLFGLIPAAVAFIVRSFVKEPERWKQKGKDVEAHLAELFSPELRHATMSGFLMALIALISWWSCNAFIPVVAKQLAGASPGFHGLVGKAAQKYQEHWVFVATTCFNVGGLIGTLLTIPAANRMGRKAMYLLYYGLGSAALFATFGMHLDGMTRLYGYFFIGLTVFGAFGSFTYYLPELFPTRLRATGAGFCYNIGRLIAAAGPFMVGQIAQKGDLSLVLATMMRVGFVPLACVLLLPLVIETKGRTLAD